MCLSVQRIQAVRLSGVLLLLLGFVALWSERTAAEDHGVVPGTHAESPGNVRVLDSFAKRTYPFYGNDVEMYRSDAILASRIAEYMTQEPMPSSPPPLTMPAMPIGGAPTAVPVSPVRLPVFDMWPVAWSLKVVNTRSFFLPQLREEVVVLVRFTPTYFKVGAFPNGNWILAHLRNRAKQDVADIPENVRYPSDSRGRWSIAQTPELLDPGPAESSRLRYAANLRAYKARPTVEQVSEFVYGTDFGNNDVYSYTSVSERLAVDVLAVLVYPEYASLAGTLKGLGPVAIAQRKEAYREAFEREGRVLYRPPERAR